MACLLLPVAMFKNDEGEVAELVIIPELLILRVFNWLQVGHRSTVVTDCIVIMLVAVEIN